MINYINILIITERVGVFLNFGQVSLSVSSCFQCLSKHSSNRVQFCTYTQAWNWYQCSNLTLRKKKSECVFPKLFEEKSHYSLHDHRCSMYFRSYSVIKSLLHFTVLLHPLIRQPALSVPSQRRGLFCQVVTAKRRFSETQQADLQPCKLQIGMFVSSGFLHG